MAYPTAVRRATGVSSTSNATSWDINAGGLTIGLDTAISNGERVLWIVIVSADGNPTITESSGTGWTKEGQASNGTAVTGALFTLETTTAFPSSNFPQFTVSSTANEQYSAAFLAFKMGAGKTVGLIAEQTANGSSTNSDPALITNSSGAAQDVEVVVTRSGDSTTVATAAPTNYNSLQTQAGGGTNGASTNTAERQINIANSGTENPGTFTSATEQWVCWTIGVYETITTADGDFDCSGTGTASPEGRAIAERSPSGAGTAALNAVGAGIQPASLSASGTAGFPSVGAAVSFASGALSAAGISGAQSWTPASLASLKGWYQGDTLTGSDSDAKNSWGDDSGTGNNAATGGSAPLLRVAALNNKNVLEFNAASTQVLGLPSGMVSAFTQGSVFFVAKTFSTADMSLPISSIGNTGGGDRYNRNLGGAAAGDFVSTIFSAATAHDGTFGDTTAWHIASIHADTNWALYRDGAQLLSEANTFQVNSGQPTIGVDPFGTYFDGQLAELLILDSSLSSGDREKAEGYLAWKWGLTANLDAGHPYKNAPPLLSGAPTFIGEVIATGALSASGIGSLATVGQAAPTGSISSSGSGAATLTGQSIAAGAISGAGVGTLNEAGSATATAAISGAGIGAMSPTGRAIEAAALTAAGVAAFSAVGESATAGGLSASATGALLLTGQSTATAVFSSTSTGILSSEGQLIFPAAISPAGSSVFTGMVEVLGIGVLSASGTGGFDAVGDTGSVTNSGDLSASGIGALTVTAAAVAEAVLGSAGIASLAASGALSAPSALSGSGTATFALTALSVASGAFSGAGAASSSNDSSVIAAGSLSTAGTSALSGVGGSGGFASGSLNADGTGNLAASSNIIISASLTVSGVGNLSDVGGGVTGGTLSVSGAGAVLESSAVVQAGAMNAAGAAALTPSPTVYATGVAISAGFGVLVGASQSIREAALSAQGAANAPLRSGVFGITTPPLRNVNGSLQDPRNVNGRLPSRNVSGSLPPRRATG